MSERKIACAKCGGPLDAVTAEMAREAVARCPDITMPWCYGCAHPLTVAIAARSLVASLPKCTHSSRCPNVATWADCTIGEPEFGLCDEHMGEARHDLVEMEYAAALRALVVLLPAP